MADQEIRTKWTAPCFATFLFTITLCHGFNFDPRFALIKKGDRHGYFGYSVTQHQIVDVNNVNRVLENLLLVGAPKQNVSASFGGAIYKCNATSTTEGCERIRGPDFDGQATRADENATDQWLGVTLHSYGKGQKVVTCGHRYIVSNAALGVCLLLNQNLQVQDPYYPCLGKPHTFFLEDFGLCQAGFSAALGPDDSLSIGAPGSVFWIGAVFQYNITERLGISKGPFMSPVLEAGAINALPPATDKYSYLGYSVAIGKFDSKNLYSVSGAPRGNERGEIVFLHRPNNANKLIYKPEHKILGKKDFSGFGSSLLVIDLNKDKFDDLIVGAPFYYDKGVGGAIYIFYGGMRMIDNTSDYTVILSREMGPQECESLSCDHARFGMSFARLGDMNNDGFEDFAVGAPYEGKGAVYIFHGSKDGVVKRFSQRIAAEEMPGGSDLRSFGYSLAGGLDLDANGYPDLAVGSYEVGTVALLRSRAIIHLLPDISVSPNITDLESAPKCDFDLTAHRCVQLQICLKFTAEPAASFSGLLNIKYQVEAERTRTFSRLELVNSTEAKKKMVSGEIKLFQQTNPDKKCFTHLAYLKDSFADKLNPMELTVKFSQTEPSYVRPRPGDPLPNINSYPILSTEGVAVGAEANTVSTYVDFVKQCGDDNMCHSNLQFDVKLDLQNNNGQYVMRYGELSQAEMTFTITNLGEAAYLTQVYIQKPPNLDYQRVSGMGQDKDVKCRPAEGDDTLIICDDIGNPLNQNNMVTFTLRISNRLAFSDRQLNITTWVNTSSTEETPLNDKFVFPFIIIREADLILSVSVRPDDQILCTGEPRGASAMKMEEDIGPAVNHSYIVTNNGPSNVPKATLIIEWPLEVGSKGAQGKFLLYLMAEPIIDKGSVTCTVLDLDTINPLNIAVGTRDASQVKVGSDNTGNRRKRETSKSRSKRAQGSKTVLGCKQESARCRKITCDLNDLQAGQYSKITLRARLWESTLLQDYRKAGDVSISSFGYLSIDRSLNIKQDPSNDEMEAITVAVPDFKDVGSKEVEWWWILLAVLGGILLLALIIFILYKCGFFKRKRPEEMQMYQAEKKNQKMLDDYEGDDN